MLHYITLALHGHAGEGEKQPGSSIGEKSQLAPVSNTIVAMPTISNYSLFMHSRT